MPETRRPAYKNLTTGEIRSRCSRIRLLICDVDGVLTDGAIYKGPGGQEFKRFHVTDGAAVALAHAAGLKVALISGRFSEATRARAEEMQVDALYNGTLDKLEPYAALKRDLRLEDAEIAYIGDDLIDIPVMQKVGLPLAVRNAQAAVAAVAVHVTRREGGAGAVREAVDWLLATRGILEETVAKLQQTIRGHSHEKT